MKFLSIPELWRADTSRFDSASLLALFHLKKFFTLCIKAIEEILRGKTIPAEIV